MLINLRVFRWGDYPEIPRWAHCNHESPDKEKREEEKLEKEM